MANRNTSGFGLIAAGTVGSTPATQGQGKYYIDAAYAVDLFKVVLLKSAAGYSGSCYYRYISINRCV